MTPIRHRLVINSIRAAFTDSGLDLWMPAIGYRRRLDEAQTGGRRSLSILRVLMSTRYPKSVGAVELTNGNR